MSLIALPLPPIRPKRPTMNALHIPVNRSPNRPWLAGYYTALALLLAAGAYAGNWAIHQFSSGFYPNIYLSLALPFAVILIGAFFLQSFFFWWGLRRVPDPIGWVMTFTGRSAFPHQLLFTSASYNQDRRNTVTKMLKERLPQVEGPLPANFSPPVVTVRKSLQAFALSALMEVLMVVMLVYLMRTFWLDPMAKVFLLGVTVLTAGALLMKIWGFFRMQHLMQIDRSGVHIRHYETKGTLKEEQNLAWESISQVIVGVPAAEAPALGIVAGSKVFPMSFPTLMAEIDYTALYGALGIWLQFEQNQNTPSAKE